MALVTVAGFEARLGRTLTGSDLTRAQAVLDDASALVSAVGDPTWTDLSIPDDVAAIVLRVARQMYENPDGARQTSIGTYSVSYPVGHGWLSPTERRTIRRAAGKSLTSVQLRSPYSTPAASDPVYYGGGY